MLFPNDIAGVLLGIEGARSQGDAKQTEPQQNTWPWKERSMDKKHPRQCKGEEKKSQFLTGEWGGFIR